MLLHCILTTLCFAFSTVRAHQAGRDASITTFDNNVIFVPPSDYTDPQVLYARTVELTDGTLLGTWENYSPEPPTVYFPIYESKDNGITWKHISNVTDQVNGWGLRYQPFLYQLTTDVGGFPAGTVLLAGNSIPTDLSLTRIDVYASTDYGITWEFVSNVADGGRAVPNNGETPIWEPFILEYQGYVVVYYSDQRDPAHGQKMVHQTSRDLKTWADPVDDIAHANYTDRPGMPTVAQLPTGDYMMTYEWGSFFGTDSYSFPVYYRINANPLKFDESPDHPLVAANTGSVPHSSPYVVWSAAGADSGSGTLIVSDGTHSTVFTNEALGAEDAWFEYKTPQPKAYTRHLRVFTEDQEKLLIMGAGHLPPSSTNNVSLSVVDLQQITIS